jgi:ribosomal-protein-alanine acetyltransferase
MIRPAKTKDLDALLEIERRCFEADRLSRAQFRRALASKSAVLLVAVERSKVQGYTLMRLRGKRARFYSLAVAPSARREGIGRALLKAAERVARARGSHSIQLELREHAWAALALYRDQGYREAGRLLEYYADKSDGRRMHKPLTSD